MWIAEKSIQVGSQHGIKGPATMANLVWANTNISGYVMAEVGSSELLK